MCRCFSRALALIDNLCWPFGSYVLLETVCGTFGVGHKSDYKPPKTPRSATCNKTPESAFAGGINAKNEGFYEFKMEWSRRRPKGENEGVRVRLRGIEPLSKAKSPSCPPNSPYKIIKMLITLPKKLLNPFF
jgi:hypothetical protein